MSDLQQRVSTEKTAVDVLREARALIERGWTQFDYARDAAGDGVEWCDDSAACWCSYGAIQKAQGHADLKSTSVLLFIEALGQPRVADWNDKPGRTQAEVLAAFDRAIELAQSEVSNA